MAEPQHFRPEKKVFLLRPVAISAVFALVAILIGTIGLILVEADILLRTLPFFVGLALVGFTYFDRSVAYNKTSYEIHHDHILHKTGGLLSDNTTNLPFRNVTQLEMKLPFLENRFYSTGHLAVHAAGSASGKVALVSVAQPEALYQILEESLRRNGFSIDRQEMVQREEPGIIGVLLDGSIGGALGAFAVLFGIAASLIPILIDVGSTFAILMTFATGAILVGLIAAFSVVSFLDRKRRTYTLWDDCIEYHDGFLTQRAKLIPFANLADTHAEEPLLKRIFGMADVVISCQGSSGNISFPSMPRAAQFRANLDRLINAAEPPKPIAAPQTPDAPAHTDGATELQPDAAPTGYAPPQLGATSGTSQTYRISPLGMAAPSLALLPLLLLLPLFAGVLSLVVEIQGAVGISIIAAVFFGVGSAVLIAGHTGFTYITQKFVLGPNSVAWSQEFISQKNTVEFTNDKITAITVHRSFFDRMIKTVSITFYSIGAAQPLQFKCLPDHEEVLAELHHRFGLPDEEPREKLSTNVQFMAVLAASFPLFIILGLCALGAIIIVPAMQMPFALGLIAAFVSILCAAALLTHAMLYHPKSELHFFDHHLMIRKGLIDHSYTYVTFHDARNVVSLRYPGQTTGTIIIDAGGAGAKMSIEHMQDPFQLHDRLDAILYQRPMRDVAQTDTFDADELGRWTPDAKNAHISGTLTLGLTLVGIPFIPLSYLYLRAYFKHADCSLQIDRVVQHRGVFFKKQITVLINRIDQLQTRRGALHNLCKNGVVEVYTVGSGHVELSLGPHPQFQEIYEAIDKRAA